MNLPDPDIRKPSGVIAGIVCGVLMAAAVITAFIRTGYSRDLSDTVIICVIASTAPWCADIFASRGLSVRLIASVMTGVSLAACLIYVVNVAMDPLTEKALMKQVLLFHAVSAAFTFCRLFLPALLKKGKEK